MAPRAEAPLRAPLASERKLERRLRHIAERLGSLPPAGGHLLLLINEAETLLFMVEQGLSGRLGKAVRRVMSSLVKKELLDHTDPDVRLAVASCLCEVTRITAPEAPYNDDVMKVVLARVVETFAQLDDVENPSFARRVSVLHTVAKLQICALMLDFDCNVIRDMFHHLFRCISHTHQGNIISYMETVMTNSIIQTDEDSQLDLLQDLAFCLLQNVTKEEKETRPASFGLAEKVIGLCQEKLKTVFIQLLRGTHINEYSEVVTSLFQDALDAGDDTVAASGHDMEVVSSQSSTRTGKTKVQPQDSAGSTRRSVQKNEEVSQFKNKVLDGSLVGSRIKVWWPDVKMFYDGVVKTFDDSLKKYKIVYDGGYHELLQLQDEKWEFVVEEQENNPDASPDMPRDRVGKASSDQSFRQRRKATRIQAFFNQENYNGVLNEIRSICVEFTNSLPVGLSGWENCHSEAETVGTVHAGQLPLATEHDLLKREVH